MKKILDFVFEAIVADSVRVHHVHVSHETFNGMSKGEFVRLKL